MQVMVLLYSRAQKLSTPEAIWRVGSPESYVIVVDAGPDAKTAVLVVSPSEHPAVEAVIQAGGSPASSCHRDHRSRGAGNCCRYFAWKAGRAVPDVVCPIAQELVVSVVTPTEYWTARKDGAALIPCYRNGPGGTSERDLRVGGRWKLVASNIVRAPDAELTVVVLTPTADRAVLKEGAGGVLSGGDCRGWHAERHGAHRGARNLIGTDVKRIPKTELAVIVQAPTLDGAVLPEGTSVVVPKG